MSWFFRLCRVLSNANLYDQVCVYLVTDKRLAPEISVISTNKTDHHDFAKLLLNVAFKTHNPTTTFCIECESILFMSQLWLFQDF